MTIWRTKEGAAFTRLVDVYGRLRSSDSYEWMTVCEARYLLDSFPLALRQKAISEIVKKRGGKDRAVEDRVRAGLEAALMREWQYRKEQKARAANG